MCGIVGYIGRDDKALEYLIDGLKSLEYRGYDSAGLAYLNKNILEIIKSVGKIKILEEKIDTSVACNLGIGHTRWATHGKVDETNSHPHRQGKITVVHNGIVENYEELKNELIKKGYSFKSQTDTEVVAAQLDDLYEQEKDMLKALNKLTDTLTGSYALAIINEDEHDKLYAIRNGSPLILAIGDNNYYLASDIPAVLKYTNKYILLNEKEYLEVSPKGYHTFKDGKEVKSKVNQFDGDYEKIEKGSYEHYMIKEINEQALVLDRILNTYFSDLDSLKKSVFDISKYQKIDIVACGSAYHTGLVAKYLIEEMIDIPVSCHIASEYRYNKLFIDKKTLVIVVSQSGETADTLAALRRVNEAKIDTLAVVNVKTSSIAREAKYVMPIEAGIEIAVATTKAYFAQIACFILLAIKGAYVRQKLSDNDVQNFQKELHSLKKIIKEVIAQDYSVIARTLVNSLSVFFIGRGIDYYLSLEGALKLKEISYIHSEAYAAGELKHGTISLVTENTPVIAIISDEKIADKTISNIKEVMSRNAKVLLITSKSISKKIKGDQNIILNDINPLLMPLVMVIPLQIIAYEVAKLKGCDIDQPRNLAKSVTVE